MKDIINQIKVFEDYKKLAIRSIFNSFYKNGGKIVHNADQEIYAFKGTIRTALFMENEDLEEKYSKKNKRLQEFAKSLIPKKGNNHIIDREKRDIFDSLMILRYWPEGYQKESFNTELSKVIDEMEKRMSQISVEKRKVFKKGEYPLHSINYYFLHKVFNKIENEPKSTLEKNFANFWRRIKIKCSDEVAKQIGYAKCGEYSKVDIGILAFSLVVSQEIIPDSLLKESIKVASINLSKYYFKELSPYKIIDRDTIIRPLSEEAISSILEVALIFLKREFKIPPHNDKIIELLKSFKNKIIYNYTEYSEEESGWGKDVGIVRFRPEIFPTIVIAETLKKSINYLRFYLLLKSQSNFGFSVDTEVKQETKFKDFINLPFGVYRILSNNFIESTNDSFTSAILFGPPGTGKSTLVKSIANELNWTFISITPSDLAQMGPSYIIDRAKVIFGNLIHIDRAVILMDEFDPFILTRDKDNKEHWQALITTCMLPLLGNLKENKRCLFFLTTNCLKEMDPAAKRLGRFDLILPVWPLSEEDRRQIISEYKPNFDNQELQNKVKASKGCTLFELKQKLRFDDKLDENLYNSDTDKWENHLKDSRPDFDISNFT